MTDKEKRTRHAQQAREWRARNNERIREQENERSAKWRAANPERWAEIHKASAQRRYDRDPEGEREKMRLRKAASRARQKEPK